MSPKKQRPSVAALDHSGITKERREQVLNKFSSGSSSSTSSPLLEGSDSEASTSAAEGNASSSSSTSTSTATSSKSSWCGQTRHLTAFPSPENEKQWKKYLDQVNDYSQLTNMVREKKTALKSALDKIKEQYDRALEKAVLEEDSEVKAMYEKWKSSEEGKEAISNFKEKARQTPGAAPLEGGIGKRQYDPDSNVKPVDVDEQAANHGQRVHDLTDSNNKVVDLDAATQQARNRNPDWLREQWGNNDPDIDVH